MPILRHLPKILSGILTRNSRLPLYLRIARRKVISIVVPIRHHSAEIAFSIKHNPIGARDLTWSRVVLHKDAAIHIDREDDLRIRRKDGALGQKAEEALIVCERKDLTVTADRVVCRDSPGVGVRFLESGIKG